MPIYEQRVRENNERIIIRVIIHRVSRVRRAVNRCKVGTSIPQQDDHRNRHHADVDRLGRCGIPRRCDEDSEAKQDPEGVYHCKVDQQRKHQCLL